MIEQPETDKQNKNTGQDLHQPATRKQRLLHNVWKKTHLPDPILKHKNSNT